MNAIAEHAVVKLRKTVRGWPAGTVGTVVSDYGDTVLVEISDDAGAAQDFLQVPVAELDLKC